MQARYEAVGSLDSITQLRSLHAEFPELDQLGPMDKHGIGLQVMRLKEALESAHSNTDGFKSIYTSEGLKPVQERGAELHDMAAGAPEGKSWREKQFKDYQELLAESDGTLRKLDKRKLVLRIKSANQVLVSV